MLFKKSRPVWHKTAHISDVEYMVLEKDGMHFEFFPEQRSARYRNVISARDGGRKFPRGYFDEKTAQIPLDDMLLISYVFDQLVQSGCLQSAPAPLPPGATRRAYMRVVFGGGSELYYTDQVSGRGLGGGTELASREFGELIGLLKRSCVFPEIGPRMFPEEQTRGRAGARIAEESGENKRAIGYRYAATGVFGYMFYSPEQLICTVSSNVVPSPPVMIAGAGVEWRSDFDQDTTIYPGIARSVVEEAGGEQVFGIVYKETGSYEINESVSVHCDWDAYAFCIEDREIATIRRCSRMPDGFPWPTDDYYEYEPYFEVEYGSEVSAELLMIMLAFPMLRFTL